MKSKIKNIATTLIFLYGLDLNGHIYRNSDNFRYVNNTLTSLQIIELT